MGNLKKKYIEYLDTAQGAKKYNDYKRILYGKPDSLVLELFKRIYPEFKDRNTLKVLDVGGGDGKRLKLLIDLFSKKRIDVSATLVDPSKAFTKDLRKSLKSSKKYQIKVIKVKFEDCFEKGKYDLILFLHSIFTFNDSGYLRNAKKMLSKNGLLIVMSNDSKSLIAGLKKITDVQYSSKRKEIRSVFEDLKSCGLKCKTEKFDTVFGGITKNNKITSKGRKILEWISLSDFENIGGGIKNKALSYLKKKIHNEILNEKEVLIKARK